MPESGFHPPDSGERSVAELQKQALKIMESEKGLILSLLRSDNEMLRIEACDFVRDSISNMLLRGDREWIEKFLDIFNFRYSVYLNSVRGFIRKPETREARHSSGLKSPSSNEILISAASLDPDAQSSDRTAYHRNLEQELERRMTTVLTPENEPRIRRVLLLIKYVTSGWQIEDAAGQLGVDGTQASRMYRLARADYPEIFGKLPEKLTELRPGSKWWGGTGESSAQTWRRSLNIERRKEIVPKLRALLAELQTPESQEQLDDLISIGGKDLVIKMIRYHLGELPHDALDTSSNVHKLTRLREAMAKKLGVIELPQHSSGERKDKDRFLPFPEFLQAVRTKGLVTVKEYGAERLNHADWPACPDEVYPGEWTNWFDLFGKEKIVFLTFEELKKEVLALGIKTSREYMRSKASHPQWPLVPSAVYDKQWPGWKIFLETKFPSFGELQAVVRAAGIKSSVEYRQRYEESGWPSNPGVVYKGQWPGWPKFLGKI